ncbi:MAG: glycosyltransferase [Alphaproteobacteria bacterium]|nr:glycosyltransferase [Alphaproteobacteria bacterium]
MLESTPELRHSSLARERRGGLSIVIFGLSITSSWGNGHATTYRALVRELTRRGHEVTFLERDMPWYARHRDLAKPPYGRTHLYRSLASAKVRFRGLVRDADIVVVGSYVPDGIAIGEWVTRIAGGATAFYDIDTPVTLATLEGGGNGYLSGDLIRRYDLYLSFTGGPVLDRLVRRHGARSARPLYCSADPQLYFPEPVEPCWDLGYMGTYSSDRQPALERLLCRPAGDWRPGRFVVAGPQYPAGSVWPSNVERIEHVPPGRHRAFYAGQRYTLNLTRAAMVRSGWSPSVRLFEAAACGTPVISDSWPGLDHFFRPGNEILVARRPDEILDILRELDETERAGIAAAARRRVLRDHSAARRAAEFETYALDVLRTRLAL